VARDLPAVSPPKGGVVFRVGRGLDAFAPPPWDRANEDGTFGNRFDDPRADRGVAEEDRFRVIYCASRLVGAYGETTARYRKSPRLLAALQQIEDDEPLDPELRGGIILKEFQLERGWGKTRLSDTLRFADFADGKAFTILREELASWLLKLELEDFDLSVVTSQQRRLTQEAAVYVYELAHTGHTNFAGIRYVSRLDPNWELWAVFYDRIDHSPEAAGIIRPDDPELLEAAGVLDLKIENTASIHGTA
jgi:hypothetical protein